MDNYNPFVVLSQVDTLTSRCLFVIAQSFDSYEKELFGFMPKALKQSLLKILTKRGYINDENIKYFLSEETKFLELRDCSKISDTALEQLSACKFLRQIDLNTSSDRREGITVKGIKAMLQTCAYLRVILLRKCANIDDSCIFEIAKNCGARLSFLNISHCDKITDKSLSYIGQNCKCLKAINLTGTQITDKGIFDLMTESVSNSVEEVHVARCCKITDEAIECITLRASKLKNLLFDNCPKLTEASRIALEQYINNSSNQKLQYLTWTINF